MYSIKRNIVLLEKYIYAFYLPTGRSKITHWRFIYNRYWPTNIEILFIVKVSNFCVPVVTQIEIKF